MMAGPARYRAQALHSETQGVKTYLGVDPVTGLPVLIYRFDSSPRAGIEQLDSPFLPRILAFRHDDSGGLIVAAFSSAYLRAPDAGTEPLSNSQLLDSARALEAASTAGVPHGSIGPDRFLLAEGSLQIEGFGVPWQTPGNATLADDVRDWARTVSNLGYLPDGQVQELLQLAQSEDAALRPLASQLVGELTGALQPVSEQDTVTLAPSEPESGSLDFPDGTWSEEAETDSESALPALPLLEDWTPKPQAASVPLEAIEIDFEPSAQFSSERLREQRQEEAVPPAAGLEVTALGGRASASMSEEGIPAISLPSAQQSATGARPSFVKDLPPGSTYRTGSAPPMQHAQPRPSVVHAADPEPAPADKRWRNGMIAALVILTIVLVGLALQSRGLLRIPWNQAPPVTAPLVTFIVDVQVEPADLPPVTLYVLESPQGSALRSGTIVGTAPRKIALDRPGNWVFEGRFQGQASGPVSIQVPEERSRVVLIRIPPAAQD